MPILDSVLKKPYDWQTAYHDITAVEDFLRQYRERSPLELDQKVEMRVLLAVQKTLVYLPHLEPMDREPVAGLHDCYPILCFEPTLGLDYYIII